jgi:predicted RNA-binding protein with PUA-like domain
MNHWLVKTEPNDYAWEDLVNLGKDHWDGVRNYQARNNLAMMKEGDKVLFYHSGKERQVVGIAKVVKESYQDPTTNDDRWVAVDLVPDKKLERPVDLKGIKADERLSELLLVRNSRLSVMPVSRQHYEIIVSKSH